MTLLAQPTLSYAISLHDSVGSHLPNCLAKLQTTCQIASLVNLFQLTNDPGALRAITLSHLFCQPRQAFCLHLN